MALHLLNRSEQCSLLSFLCRLSALFNCLDARLFYGSGFGRPYINNIRTAPGLGKYLSHFLYVPARCADALSYIICVSWATRPSFSPPSIHPSIYPASCSHTRLYLSSIINWLTHCWPDMPHSCSHKSPDAVEGRQQQHREAWAERS